MVRHDLDKIYVSHKHVKSVPICSTDKELLIYNRLGDLQVDSLHGKDNGIVSKTWEESKEKKDNL